MWSEKSLEFVPTVMFFNFISSILDSAVRDFITYLREKNEAADLTRVIGIE